MTSTRLAPLSQSLFLKSRKYLNVGATIRGEVQAYFAKSMSRKFKFLRDAENLRLSQTWLDSFPKQVAVAADVSDHSDILSPTAAAEPATLKSTDNPQGA
jgi:hypothetical protein